MYSSEEKKRALELYDEIGSSLEVVEALGYPGFSTMRRWIATRDDPPKERKKKPIVTFMTKMEALSMLGRGASAEEAAAYAGVVPQTLLLWRNTMLKKGTEALMTKADSAYPPQPAPEDMEGIPCEVEALRRRVFELEFENRLMREVVDIVKKDPRVDPRTLANREKALLIDAMRGTYSLSFLESRLGIADSSYRYARKSLARPDKWAEAADIVVEVFEAAGRARGYRYVHNELRERLGDRCPGEKKVRRLMAERGCAVIYAGRKRKWSSYAGELSDAPPNLLLRRDGTHDFSADAPNEKWLTDITEFSLPDDDRKVYLSPVVDCFGGELASWSIGTSPNAELANSCLLGACAMLGPGEHPIIHNDRGAHYRWPGWIGICEERGLVRSMSRKGRSPDNAACEGFFGRLKNEFFYGRDWKGVTAERFMELLDEWLVYYNEGRRKQSLGWMTPMEHRRAFLGAA